MTKKIVVTISAVMKLSEAKTSVLSKGQSFVPLDARYDEFQTKLDCVQFVHRPRLKVHFHGRETESDTSGDDPFTKFRPTNHINKFR